MSLFLSVGRDKCTALARACETKRKKAFLVFGLRRERETDERVINWMGRANFRAFAQRRAIRLCVCLFFSFFFFAEKGGLQFLSNLVN